MRNIHSAAGAALLLAAAAVPGRTATSILLQGSVSANCVIDVTADPDASNLPLDASGAQRVQVGTIMQSCNKKSGFTLTVDSANCAAAPAGAKVSDPASGEILSYSVEFANPTTGGSLASVTGLLAAACVGETGRDVTDAKISAEASTIFVNFTGDPGLTSGTFTDTLTITMNLK